MRRFQQERQPQQYYSNNEPLNEFSGAGFTYKLPIQQQQQSQFTNDDEISFAVGPASAKFYENFGNSIKDTTEIKPILTYKNVLSTENDPVHLTSDGIPSYKVKAPMNINPKTVFNNDYLDGEMENTYDKSKSKDVYTREEWINSMRNEQKELNLNSLQPHTQSLKDVAKKPVDLNSAWVIVWGREPLF